MKTISGIYEPDEGEFSFGGEPVAIDGPNDATALGIATVYQDLALCDNLDTVANLFLGRELMASGPSVQLDEAASEDDPAKGLLITIPTRVFNEASDSAPGAPLKLRINVDQGTLAAE